MQQDTFDFAAETAPPAKPCECGCGQPAPLAKWNDKRLGHVKGQPVRFIPGHNAKKPMPSVEVLAEAHLCECGCGQITPLITTHRPDRGLIKGRPRRFLPGHGGRERRSGRKPHLFVEVGQRIGYGVVLEADIRIPFNYGKSKTARGARLLCDCGNEYTASIPQLVGAHPKVKSCGHRMLEALAENRGKPREGRRYRPFIDRTGQRFGRLLVLREAERTIPFGAQPASWVCLCDCGNTTVQPTSALTNGVKSCGCLLQERTLPPGRAGRNALLSHYRQGARDRNLAWELTDEEFDRLTSSDCFYCGQPPSAVCANGNSKYIYTGIDRIDNDLGYTPENCCPACAQCNRSKNSLRFEDFMAWVARLTEYQWFHPDSMPNAMLRAAAISKPLLQVVRDTGTDG